METDPPGSTPAAFDMDARHEALVLTGAWTLPELGAAIERAESARIGQGPRRIDATGVSALDTAGALLLLRLLRKTGIEFAQHRIEGLRAENVALLKLVAQRLTETVPPSEPHATFRALLGRIGAAVEQMYLQGRDLLGFLGLTLVTLAQVLLRRRKPRLTSPRFHMGHARLR